MIFVYLIKKRGEFYIFILKSVLIQSLFIWKKKIYKLKERYLQIYKKEFQPNFIKYIYIYIYIYILFYLEKDSLLLTYLEKEFHKFVPKDSNYI